MTTDNTTEFNILRLDPKEMDEDNEVLVYIDLAYEGAHHRVSFYLMIEDVDNVEEEVNEFMEKVKTGHHDDIIYDQLESNQIDTRVFGPYSSVSENTINVPAPTLEAWNNLMPIERNAYREMNRLYNLRGNYGRKLDKAYIA